MNELFELLQDPIVLFGIGIVGVISLIAWHESLFETKIINEREESLKVSDTSYKPYESDTNVSPTFVGGKVGFSVNTTSTPERHMVIFKGTKEIKKLIVDDESIFDEVEAGDKITAILVDRHKVRKGEKPNSESFRETEIKCLKIGKQNFEEYEVLDLDFK